MDPIIQRLHEVLVYDPLTGSITWKVTLSNRGLAGKEAGQIHNVYNYRMIRVDKRMHRAHRVAWALYYGVWPKQTLDHINGIRTDNRLSNLREATMAEQAQNRKRHPRDGLPGAHLNNGRWVAHIQVNRKQMHLGSFATAEEAHACYLKAKAKYHTFNPIPRELRNETTAI